MTFRRSKFKALDARTGRLERAVNLIEDGEIKGVYTKRRDADDKHPLSKPFRVGADRATISRKMRGEVKTEDAQYTYVVGYSASDNLYEQRTVPVLSLSSGGAVITYTEV